MKEVIFFEFFSGAGTLSGVFKDKGVKTYSFDIRKRKGVCEPDFRVDLTEFKTFEDLLFHCRIAYSADLFFQKYIPVFWFAIPCTSWSIASGGFHFDKDFTPNTPQAKKDIDIVFWFMKFWQSAEKPLFYLENPFGLLRKFKPFIHFCTENRIVEHTVNMGDFGFPSKKPTNIFTNSFIDLSCIIPGDYAGGSEAFNNMTVVQRQAYPQQFCEFIYNDFREKEIYYTKKSMQL